MEDCLTRRSERLQILLLIHTLAAFASWLAGLGAKPPASTDGSTRSTANASSTAHCVSAVKPSSDNHVHLLLTPPAVGATSQLMQKLGRQYVGQFNARHRRTGTLWEGRYKACLVDSETYVLRCYRYIDLNPVRARITNDPMRFRWSSAAAHGGHHTDSLLTPHPAYTALGETDRERGAAYGAIIREAIADDELLAIRMHLQQQRALGRDAFRAMVEAKTLRFAGVRPAHRPPSGK